MLKPKIKKLKFLRHLIGRKLPSHHFGEAGRAFEDILEEDFGITVNRGSGPDDPLFGIEYKTRDLSAVSPQTIASMTVKDIIATPYRESAIFKKFQQQIRVKTRDRTIVEADLYDFSSSQIQDLIERAYEYARQQLIKDNSLERTSSGPDNIGYWGYFEATNKSSPDIRAFRINPAGMNDYETMAKSTFNNIFDYDENI
jgi:hypothetical protein